MNKKFSLLLACALTSLTACTVTRYDHYGRGSVRYSRPYAASSSSSWVVADAYEDYSTPFYISGGINYYYDSGQYVYYVNGRRHCVPSLPRGGYYNHRHPLYGRGPAVIRGYSAPAPRPPAYAPSWRPPYGSGSYSSRPPSFYRPPSSQPPPSYPPSRSYPSSPYFGGSRRSAPPPSPSPQTPSFRTPYTAPVPPTPSAQPPRNPGSFRPDSRPVTPMQPGGAPFPPRPAPPSAAPAAPQGAPQPSRPAAPKKKADEPEAKTNAR
jgi:hypothetical protein